MGDLRRIQERVPTKEADHEPECDRCEDTGWAMSADGGAGSATRCTCPAARPGADAVLSRLVPERYQGCTLGRWQGEVPPQVLTWMEQPADALFLYGRQGRGKTHLATAAFAELVAGGMGGLWRDALGLVNFCRRNLDEAGREMGRLEAADLLLLDDFHLARTDYAREELDALVRARHAACRPLIVTANASLEHLAADRDPATLSRLRGCEVELGGPDWRGKRSRK